MKKLLSLVITLTLLTACSGDDSPETTTTPIDTTLLKKTVTVYSSGDTITSSYTYDGNKLKSIINSDNSYDLSSVYTYTGNLITNIKYIGTHHTSETFIEYDSNNRKVIERTYNTILNPIMVLQKFSKTIISYNPDRTITSTTYTGDNESDIELNNSVTIAYVNENTISVEADFGNYTHTYDTKNNPMKNVLGYHEYSMPSFNGKHNLLTAYKSETDPGHTFTYIYNSTDYPISLEQASKYGTSTKQHFYE